MSDSQGNQVPNGPIAKVRLVGSREKDTETLWAMPLGGNLYRLENSPFFAYGVSWLDTVEAEVNASSNALDYVKRVEKSGNRTLRAMFDGAGLKGERAQEVLKNLIKLGCSYEGMAPRLVSVNVPVGVDLKQVTAYLTDQSGIQWEYVDPTYEEVQRGIA